MACICTPSLDLTTALKIDIGNSCDLADNFTILEALRCYIATVGLTTEFKFEFKPASDTNTFTIPATDVRSKSIVFSDFISWEADVFINGQLRNDTAAFNENPHSFVANGSTFDLVFQTTLFGSPNVANGDSVQVIIRGLGVPSC